MTPATATQDAQRAKARARLRLARARAATTGGPHPLAAIPQGFNRGLAGSLDMFLGNPAAALLPGLDPQPFRRGIERIAKSVAQLHGANVEVTMSRGTPALLRRHTGGDSRR